MANHTSHFMSRAAPKVRVNVGKGNKMIVVDLGFHLQANKSRSYRQSVTDTFRAMSRFFDEQGFATRKIEDELMRDPFAFRLTTDDLTEAGNTWFMTHFDPWLGRMDRRTKRTSFDDILAALRKTIGKK